MSLNRTHLRLAAGAMVLLAGLPAFGQGVGDAQFFAPADVTPYGSGPQPKEGYFFVFDGIKWGISAPESTTIGAVGQTRSVFYGPVPTAPVTQAQVDANTVPQSNTLSTGALRNVFKEGNRIEFGRIVDECGWFVSTYRLNRQTQRMDALSVDMVFLDPNNLLTNSVGTDANTGNDIVVNLPLTFDTIAVRNVVETWSVELMALQRTRPFHHGGNLEWFAGVRYIEFDEDFSVDARGDATITPAPTVPAVLADSNWNTEAENHIIGPQVGIRYFKQSGRWVLSSEGRFLAGFNSQNIRHLGTLGTGLNPPGTFPAPENMDTTSFNHSDHLREWSPTVEVRAELRYALTSAISFRAGWTGIWIDGLARASNMIDYTAPSMGLLPQHNRQDAFLNGFTIGVDVNR